MPIASVSETVESVASSNAPANSAPSKGRAARTKYNNNYYAKNKHRLAKRRKAKYDNDEVYKSSVIKSVKRQRHRKAAYEELEVAKLPTGIRMMSVKDGMGISHEVKMFTVARLAERLGVSASCIRHWERVGIVPKSNYRSEGNHRLYTQFQVEALSNVYHDHFNPSVAWRITEAFIKDVYKVLAKLVDGLPVPFPVD